METRYKPAPCQNFIYRINALTRQCWSHLRVECWLFVWTFYSYTVTKPGKKSAKINTAAAKKEQNHSFIKPQWAMKWTFKKKTECYILPGFKVLRLHAWSQTLSSFKFRFNSVHCTNVLPGEVSRLTDFSCFIPCFAVSFVSFMLVKKEPTGTTTDPTLVDTVTQRLIHCTEAAH